MKQKENGPTAAELEILSILWINQPLSVREVHEVLSDKKEVGYTTTLKIMQNMTSKGLLSRELDGKLHRYTAVYKKETTQKNLLDKFLETTFGGSASGLVMQLLGDGKTSKEELAEIKKTIDELEKNQKK